MHDPIAIRRAERDHLPAAAACLLATALGFADADAVPAWLMRTTDECGGVSLVALDGADVVGALHSIPGRDGGRAFLFTCGLAVAATHRDRGLGRALKLEQRRRARTLGYERIAWTADPVNGRALRLYLTVLGARLVAYRSGLHDGLRADPGHRQDDVAIVWELRSPPRRRDDGGSAVSLPWSRPSRADRDRVRAEMTQLLARGYLGTRVDLEREQRTCRVVFTPP